MIYISLLLLIVIGGEFFYFNKIMDDKKKHIFMLIRENDNLKKKINSLNLKSPLSITFSNTPYQFAEVNAKTSLYISPLSNAQTLCLFDTVQKVNVLCKAEINNEIWYEINLDASSRLNTRGWVKSTSLTFVEHSLINI